MRLPSTLHVPRGRKWSADINGHRSNGTPALCWCIRTRLQSLGPLLAAHVSHRFHQFTILPKIQAVITQSNILHYFPNAKTSFWHPAVYWFEYTSLTLQRGTTNSDIILESFEDCQFLNRTPFTRNKKSHRAQRYIGPPVLICCQLGVCPVNNDTISGSGCWYCRILSPSQTSAAAALVRHNSLSPALFRTHLQCLQSFRQGLLDKADSILLKFSPNFL